MDDKKHHELMFGFRYTTKDLILFALSIGIGSDGGKFDDYPNNHHTPPLPNNDDLKFLYEAHAQFSSIPTFCLTLIFWSNYNYNNTTNNKNNNENNDVFSNRIPSFPPPAMKLESMLPCHCLIPDSNTQEVVDLTPYPVIHMWQSIIYEESLPVPPTADVYIETALESQTILVEPKSVGTFVTTQSRVFVNHPNTTTTNTNTSNAHSLLCTMQSTALVYGLEKEWVRPYHSGIAKWNEKIPRRCHQEMKQGTPPTYEWTFATSPTQALLYRLASGDSNRIHVDTSAADMMATTTTTRTQKRAPLLHGLFTLSLAFRALLKLEPTAHRTLRRLEGKFTQPAFVGDRLCTQLWKVQSSSSASSSDGDDVVPKIVGYIFRVFNPDTHVTVVDGGYMELELREPARVGQESLLSTQGRCRL